MPPFGEVSQFPPLSSGRIMLTEQGYCEIYMVSGANSVWHRVMQRSIIYHASPVSDSRYRHVEWWLSENQSEAHRLCSPNSRMSCALHKTSLLSLEPCSSHASVCLQKLPVCTVLLICCPKNFWIHRWSKLKNIYFSYLDAIHELWVQDAAQWWSTSVAFIRPWFHPQHCLKKFVSLVFYIYYSSCLKLQELPTV